MGATISLICSGGGSVIRCSRSPKGTQVTHTGGEKPSHTAKQNWQRTLTLTSSDGRRHTSERRPRARHGAPGPKTRVWGERGGYPAG